MNDYRRCLLFTIAILGLVLVSAYPALAEVSAQSRVPGSTDTLLMDLMSIVDDADPVPQVAVGWESIGVTLKRRVINANGDVRPDGRPDVAWHKGNGWPVVVWAYNNGPDHDIALAAWNGTDWNAVEWVTSTSEDERDPRVFIKPDGSLIITYWIDGADPHVKIVSRAHNALLWSVPVRVSPNGEIARRPSAAFFQGTTYVAYERAAGTQIAPETEYVIRGSNGTTAFNQLHGVTVAHLGDLQLMLHVNDEPNVSRMWVDWIQSGTQYAHAVFQNDTSTWGTNRTRPFDDPSWVGREMIRRQIERLVVGQALATDPGGLDPTAQTGN